MKRATLTAKKKGDLQSGIFLVIRNTTKIQKLFFIMEIYEIYINLWNLNIST